MKFFSAVNFKVTLGHSSDIVAQFSTTQNQEWFHISLNINALLKRLRMDSIEVEGAMLQSGWELFIGFTKLEPCMLPSLYGDIQVRLEVIKAEKYARNPLRYQLWDGTIVNVHSVKLAQTKANLPITHVEGYDRRCKYCKQLEAGLNDRGEFKWGWTRGNDGYACNKCAHICAPLEMEQSLRITEDENSETHVQGTGNFCIADIANVDLPSPAEVKMALLHPALYTTLGFSILKTGNELQHLVRALVIGPSVTTNRQVMLKAAKLADVRMRFKYDQFKKNKLQRSTGYAEIDQAKYVRLLESTGNLDDCLIPNLVRILADKQSDDTLMQKKVQQIIQQANNPRTRALWNCPRPMQYKTHESYTSEHNKKLQDMLRKAQVNVSAQKYCPYEYHGMARDDAVEMMMKHPVLQNYGEDYCIKVFARVQKLNPGNNAIDIALKEFMMYAENEANLPQNIPNSKLKYTPYARSKASNDIWEHDLRCVAGACIILSKYWCGEDFNLQALEVEANKFSKPNHFKPKKPDKDGKIRKSLPATGRKMMQYAADMLEDLKDGYKASNGYVLLPPLPIQAVESYDHYCNRMLAARASNLDLARRSVDNHYSKVQHSIVVRDFSKPIGFKLKDYNGRVLVSGVHKGSFAEQSGVFEHDLISSFNNVVINSVNDFKREFKKANRQWKDTQGDLRRPTFEIIVKHKK